MSSNNDETAKRSANSKAREKNAQVHQDRDHAAKIVHSQFDNIGLTKRNAEYMFKFNQALGPTKFSAEQKKTIIQSMVQQLLDGQKSGKTAKICGELSIKSFKIRFIHRHVLLIPVEITGKTQGTMLSCS